MTSKAIFFAVGFGALAACEPVTLDSAPQVPTLQEQVLTQLAEVAGPNQNIQTARLSPEDNCYWFQYVGPVETTELPLLNKQGGRICGSTPEPVEAAS